VRSIHPGNGKALRWGRPPFVTIVFNQAGSPDIPDGSHLTALRNALAAWNDVDGTTLHVTEITAPAQMARTDWESDSVHLVLFDQDDSYGLLPLGHGHRRHHAGWFYESGAITDADILFNGQDFQFTTSGQPALRRAGRGRARNGALRRPRPLGLGGATMYPTSIRASSCTAACPRTSATACASPTRRRPSPRSAGWRGTPATTARRGGARCGARRAGPDAGQRAQPLERRLHAERARSRHLHALRQPARRARFGGNLGGGNTVETDFEATVLGDWTVAQGQALSLGNLFVEPDVALGLGRNSDDYPLRAIAGQTRSFLVRGTGLAAGSTLTPSDPSLSVSSVTWAGTQVAFQVTTPAARRRDTSTSWSRTARASARSCRPRSRSPRAILGRRGRAAEGNVAGGTQLTISGSRFQPARASCSVPRCTSTARTADVSVVDAGTIALTTRAGPAGVYDVVVIDPTGVEDRLVAGFRMASVPTVSAVFPAAGSAAGGTTVTISGAQFDPGCTVAIDGIVQASVVRESAGVLRLTTQAYAPGGPYVLEVTNPLGASAQAAFAFVAAADPVIDALDPALGTAEGGDEITVHGANFNPTSEVVFGADPQTGAGGSVARSSTFVDAGTLIVTTPRHASGASSILVRDASTARPCCSPRPSCSPRRALARRVLRRAGGGPADPREAAASLAWLALTLGMLLLRRRRLRSATLTAR
jgi:hypothetical protein